MNSNHQIGIRAQENEMFLEEFITSRFKTNILCLKKFFPDIADLFENYQLSKPVEIFCTENGIPNAKIGINEEIIYSEEDPILFCKRQVDSFLSNNVLKQAFFQNVNDPYGQIHYKYNNKIAELIALEQRDTIKLQDLSSLPICTMVGVGLGYQLAELYERIEVLNLILVEPDLDLFYLSLHTFDWANLINFIVENNYGINLIIGKELKYFEIDFRRYFVRHGLFLSGTYITYVHLETDLYLEIANIVNANYKYIHSCLGFFDDHLFATSHACYALTNHKHFVNNKKLHSKYENYPVFIIGSGPSLDKDLSFIKKNQDKAIIIACGSAIDILYHVGIKPDFFANTERVPEIKQSLTVISDSSFFEDIILLCGDVCHPKTLECFRHTAIFSKPDEPTFNYISYFFKELNQVQNIQFTNPLVGNMAVSGAVYLGFKNLYLFGIDNGRREKNDSIHSEYTTLYKKRGYSENVPCYVTDKPVPANFGGNCLTGYLFEISNKYIGETLVNDQLIDCRDIVCHNCSDGAKINNTIAIHSYELEESFLHKPTLDKKEFLDYIDREKTLSFSITKEDIIKLFDVNKFTLLCNEIKTILKRPSSSREKCILTLQDISEKICNMTFDNNSRYIAECLEGTLQSFFITACRITYGYSDEEKSIAKFKEIVNVLCDFLTEAPDLFSHLPDYIMGEHKKYYPNGKVGKDMKYCKAPKLPDEIKMIVKEYDDPVKKFVKQYS